MNKTQLKAKLDELEVEYDEKATKAELQVILTEAEEGGPEAKSIVPDDYKKKYKTFGGNCGDDMAGVLNDTVKDEKGKIDISALQEVMAQNDIDTDRWSNLNIGQRRMNLGNVLRAKAKRGERVDIGDTAWNEDAETKAA